MNDNKYFDNLQKKFNKMERHVIDIHNMTINLQISLSDLSKDLENGNIKTLEEVKKIVDNIRQFGYYTSHMEKEFDLKSNTYSGRPKVICELDENNDAILKEVNIDFDSPLKCSLDKDEVRGMSSTVVWFIKHMIPVDFILKNKEGKENKYVSAIISNIKLNSIEDSTIIEISNFEDAYIEFEYKIKEEKLNESI